MVDQGEVFDLIDDKTFKPVVENRKLWEISERLLTTRVSIYVPPVATMPP